MSKQRKSGSKAYQYHQHLADKQAGQSQLVEIEKTHRHSPLASFRWALRGLYYAYSTQRNFRLELCMALVVLLLAIYFGIAAYQWSIVLFSIALVLGTELFNTALEYMVDLYEKKYNYLAMIAKDIAASCVLLSALHACIQGAIVFAPHIRTLLATLS